MKSYPTVRFVRRNGQAIAVMISLTVVALGIWFGATGGSWVWGAAIIGAGALAYLVLSAFAELVDVVGDTLIPPE